MVRLKVRAPAAWTPKFTFFAQCVFLTNNADGDNLLKIILHPDMALKINQAMPAPYHPPRTPNREYDAIDVLLDRPVILNYQCDLLKLSDITPMPGWVPWKSNYALLRLPGSDSSGDCRALGTVKSYAQISLQALVE